MLESHQWVGRMGSILMRQASLMILKPAIEYCRFNATNPQKKNQGDVPKLYSFTVFAPPANWHRKLKQPPNPFFQF